MHESSLSVEKRWCTKYQKAILQYIKARSIVENSTTTLQCCLVGLSQFMYLLSLLFLCTRTHRLPPDRPGVRASKYKLPPYCRRNQTRSAGLCVNGLVLGAQVTGVVAATRTSLAAGVHLAPRDHRLRNLVVGVIVVGLGYSSPPLCHPPLSSSSSSFLALAAARAARGNHRDKEQSTLVD